MLLARIQDVTCSKLGRNQGFKWLSLVKAIPVTGRGRPYGYETSRLPHFLENLPTDGGEVVSLTRRPPVTPPRRIPSTHFC
jgi:hypothetical protein